MANILLVLAQAKILLLTFNDFMINSTSKTPAIVVLYEDNHLLVIDKPAGLLSQADATGDADVLTIAKAYLAEKYNKPGKVYLGLVHRLDRPVSGVMILARTSKAASRLSEQIRKHEWEKTYEAIVEGEIKKSLKLQHYLLKNGELNKSKVVDNANDKAKLATLELDVIASVDNHTLVSVNLISGRSHQIRVQLSANKTPIFADIKYGAKRHPKPLDIALRSRSISFIHPVTKEKMQITAERLESKKPWNLFKTA